MTATALALVGGRYLISGGLLVTAIEQAKFAEWPWPRRPARGDLGWVFLWTLIATGLTALSPWAAIGWGLVGSALLGALWLDAVLFHVFTIELGPGGAAGVRPSELFHELAGMRRARHFFSRHLAFSLIPFVAVAGWALGLTSIRVAPLLFFSWSVLAASTGALGSETFAFAAIGAYGIAASVQPTFTGLAVWIGTSALAALSTRGGRGSLRSFFRPRPLSPFSSALEPVASLRSWDPQVPTTSSAHGVLRGVDVVLITVESMALAHVGPGRAEMPFLAERGAQGVSSRHHFPICSLTNEAHIALYSSAHRPSGRFELMALLGQAGYQRLYLTSADTSQYGLGAILERAGLEVVDRRWLARDALIPTQGLALLEERMPGQQPFFLHVHTSDTHLPYRAADPRFQRFAGQGDYGRYLNGLEATDALLAELVQGLEARNLTSNPLVIITADHGQSFGALGYHSHGSAVVAEQMRVPLVLSHPALPPKILEHSSHFDVMPTVLDLLGVEIESPCLGTSLFHPAAPPQLLLSAGRPSRSTTSNFGLVLGNRKWMVDLAVDQVHEMGWNDEAPRRLEGEEKARIARWIFDLHARQGMT